MRCLGFFFFFLSLHKMRDSVCDVCRTCLLENDKCVTTYTQKVQHIPQQNGSTDSIANILIALPTKPRKQTDTHTRCKTHTYFFLLYPGTTQGEHNAHYVKYSSTSYTVTGYLGGEGNQDVQHSCVSPPNRFCSSSQTCTVSDHHTTKNVLIEALTPR